MLVLHLVFTDLKRREELRVQGRASTNFGWGGPKNIFVFDICWLLMLVFTDLKKREELRVQGRAFGPYWWWPAGAAEPNTDSSSLAEMLRLRAQLGSLQGQRRESLARQERMVQQARALTRRATLYRAQVYDDQKAVRTLGLPHTRLVLSHWSRSSEALL